MHNATKNNRSLLFIIDEQIFAKKEKMDKYMKIKEVAEHLRLSQQSVRRLIESGRLTAHKIGQCSYRVPENALNEFLIQSLAKPFIGAPDMASERKEEPQ